MFYENGRWWKRHPLGKIRGRKGARTFRYMNGEQFTSRLAENYHSSSQWLNLEKLRNFGEAGIIARHINNNPLLKTLWAESFNKHVYSVYDEISRSFIKHLNRGMETLPADEHLREVIRRKRQSKLQIAPDPDAWSASAKRNLGLTEEELKTLKKIFKGDAQSLTKSDNTVKSVSFNAGSIELCGYNKYDNVTGLITFTCPKDRRETLRITGSKCGARNRELEEKALILEEKNKLKYIRSMLNAAYKYNLEYSKRKQQRADQILEWKMSGHSTFMCPAVSKGIVYRFDEDVDIRTEPGMQSFAFDEFEAKRIRQLFIDIKESFGFDMVPNEQEYAEASAALDICDMENKLWGIELQQRKKERVKNEKKYLKQIFAAVTPVFARRPDGSFYLVNAEEVQAAAAKFKKYTLYLIPYNQDWEGCAESFSSETFSGRTEITEETEEIYYPLVILILYALYIRKIMFVKRE